MSWHPECYRKFSGKYVTGKAARYKTLCQYGNNCIFGGSVLPGQEYYYDPTYKARANKSREDLMAAARQASAQMNQRPDVQATAINLGETTAEVSDTTIPVVKLSYSQQQEIINSISYKIPGIVSTQIRSLVKPDDIVAEITLKANDVVKQQMKDADAKLQAKLDEIAAITRVEVVLPSSEVKDCGVQHKQFPILLKAVMARCNVWLAGPSASGKTTAAQNVATALGLPFRYTGAVGDPYALVGYCDANGRYVRTQFREAWENGGIFLWDEVDASDPNALLAFNAALANGTAPFPDGCIPKHKDCILIAAANTWGHGATHEYVGRLKMDAAFLKRFVFLSWDYDDEMERQTAPNIEWTKNVQNYRRYLKEKGIRAMITPRESYAGAALLNAGIPWDVVEEMTIFSALTPDQKKQLQNTDKMNKAGGSSSSYKY